jgi:nucleoside-diphosphate-sugar epimerase
MAHSYFDEFALPACSVRPFNIYGPGQIGSGAIHHFTVRALAGEDIVIHGDGSQIRAWCYVDDIVEALLLILEREEAVGQVFNVGNARSVVTVFDLAARIKRLAGSDSEIVFKPLHYTDVEMRIPNVDKARKQLGWEPQVDLDDGLERTIAWYRERQPVQSLASKA